MNTENILAVADAIEQHSIEWLGFNMNTFMYASDFHEDKTGHNCGTSACIAGWSAAVALRAQQPKDTYNWGFRDAADWLGIDDEQREQLFFASNHPGAGNYGETGPLRTITPADAVKTLRNLAASGEVNWEA